MKKLAKVLMVLVALAVIAGGVFYFYKNKVRTGAVQTPVAAYNYIPKIDDTFSVQDGAVHISVNRVDIPIPGADPNTFQILGNRYAKDSTHVWSYAVGAYQLPDISNPASFMVINQSFAKSSNAVYINIFHQPVLSGADPATFVALDSKNAKDANHAYDFLGKTFDKIADVKTLTSLAGGTWFKDSVHIYAGDGEIVDQADPATFTDLGACYGKDSTHIFFCDNVPNFVITDTTPPKAQIVSGADIGSFEVMGGGYARDNYHIFVNGAEFDDADVATFRQIGQSPYFEDKSHIWYDSEGGTPITELVLIPNADVSTFTASPGSTMAEDANYTYGFNGRGVFLAIPKTK